MGGSEKDPRELQERTERRAKLCHPVAFWGLLGLSSIQDSIPPELLSMQSEIGRKGHHHLKLGSKQR